MEEPRNPDVPADLPRRLIENLRELEPVPPVPPTVDVAILADARRHLTRARRRPWRLLAPVASAAALLLVAILVPQWSDRSTPETHSPVARVEDVNEDGQVDILDAFRLHRILESGAVELARHDVNHDGVVDPSDIDHLARAAVSLR